MRSAHDGPTLKRRVDVAAHRAPGFRARPVAAAHARSLTEMIEAVVFRRALKQKLLSGFKAGTGAAFGISEKLLLQVRKTLRLEDRNFALILQGLFSCGYVFHHRADHGALVSSELYGKDFG